MLEVESQGSKDYIPLVDLHTHLGKEPILDPSGRETYRSTTLRDLIEFYERMGHELVRRSQESSKFSFRIKSPGMPNSSLLRRIVEKAQASQITGWLLDHAISFPFNDALAAQTSPRFQKPNDRVLLRTRDPQYARVIPFCRVDPFDGKKALEEVNRCVQLGARGLKLHPLSQAFVEKIRSDEVMDLLQLSASLNIPVIFDVANPGVGEDIGAAVEETKSRIGHTMTLKVILGHFGFSYASEIMHDLIQRPEFVTDLSGCRGDDVPFFFTKLIDFNGLSGINKVCYASDFNYFGVPQCGDFISYLLSNDFKDLVGNENHLESTKKVLGLNTLSLFSIRRIFSALDTHPAGTWVISTEKLASQILTALKNRLISIRPLLLSLEGNTDITAWTVQKASDWSFTFLARSQENLTCVLMEDDLSQSENLEKALQALWNMKTDDAIGEFDLMNIINVFGGS